MDTLSTKIYKSVSEGAASKGKTLLLKYLDGGRLNSSQSIYAKCCDCMGYFIDGRDDCEIPTCSLYPFYPYKSPENKVKYARLKSARGFRSKNGTPKNIG